MRALLQWCPLCQSATGNVPCSQCDGVVCAACAADPGNPTGDLCRECAAFLAAEDQEG